MSVCCYCCRREQCFYAFEMRRDGKVSILVCQGCLECLERSGTRLEVLGRDFIFVSDSRSRAN